MRVQMVVENDNMIHEWYYVHYFISLPLEAGQGHKSHIQWTVMSEEGVQGEGMTPLPFKGGHSIVCLPFIAELI